MLTTTQSRGFSLARGFIVFVMPAVHSVMLYSSEEVKMGGLGIVLGSLAEGPGAQLFMFLMGIFIVLGRSKTTKQIVVRSLLIGGLGYLLNLFRLVIPYYLNLLPATYVSSITVSHDSPAGWQLFVIGDILQFAALAYLFCALLYKHCSRIAILVFIIVLVWWISPYTWNVSKLPNVSVFYLLTGIPPKVFFPFFPWIFFPVLGLVFGRVLQLYSSVQFTRAIILTGILMITLGKLITTREPLEWNTNFYRQGRGGTLLHGGIALLWTALFIGIAQLKTSNLFFRLLNFASRHITIIYVLQWIIIMWMFRLFGYNSLTLVSSLFALLVTSILSFALSWLFTQTPSLKKQL